MIYVDVLLMLRQCRRPAGRNHFRWGTGTAGTLASRIQRGPKTPRRYRRSHRKGNGKKRLSIPAEADHLFRAEPNARGASRSSGTARSRSTCRSHTLSQPRVAAVADHGAGQERRFVRGAGGRSDQEAPPASRAGLSLGTGSTTLVRNRRTAPGGRGATDSDGPGRGSEHITCPGIVVRGPGPDRQIAVGYGHGVAKAVSGLGIDC